jgi:phospho-N-acetylmuramoyl-pentapeptide-transferase
MHQLIIALIVSFAVCLVIGPILIPLLHRLKFGQQVRDDGPKQHLSKQGTPTMGGIIMILGLAATLALLVRGSKEFVILALLATAGFGLVGFLDDFIKIRMKRSLGLKAYQKIIGQFGLAIVMAVWAYRNPLVGPEINIPWLNVPLDLGWFYIPFTVFVIIAVVNGVNLTDGLDGLASGVMMINAFTFAAIFLVQAMAAEQAGDVMHASNLTGMMQFSAALAGACLGFLRFNCYPARVFMGDTGSLALGGALSAMAILSKGMLLLPFTGAMFVASCVSVILQVGSYRLRNKKRIFLMAPLHHHFELKGYPETKIVAMYMIITAGTCMLVLLSYV